MTGLHGLREKDQIEIKKYIEDRYAAENNGDPLSGTEITITTDSDGSENNQNAGTDTAESIPTSKAKSHRNAKLNLILILKLV